MSISFRVGIDQRLVKRVDVELCSTDGLYTTLDRFHVPSWDAAEEIRKGLPDNVGIYLTPIYQTATQPPFEGWYSCSNGSSVLEAMGLYQKGDELRGELPPRTFAYLLQTALDSDLSRFDIPSGPYGTLPRAGHRVGEQYMRHVLGLLLELSTWNDFQGLTYVSWG